MSHDTATPGNPDPSDVPDLPDLPEFSNVRRDADGMWRATHRAGESISARSWLELEVAACAVRVRAQWLRTTWSDGSAS